VLIKHGFGDMVRAHRHGRRAGTCRQGSALARTDEIAHLEPAARVRRALEELGPTFVKLGQILATRVDLFAPEWIANSASCQDAAPASPFEDIRAQLTEDLAKRPRPPSPRWTYSRWRRHRSLRCTAPGWPTGAKSCSRCAGRHPPHRRGGPAAAGAAGRDHPRRGAGPAPLPPA